VCWQKFCEPFTHCNVDILGIFERIYKLIIKCTMCHFDYGDNYEETNFHAYTYNTKIKM